MAVEKLRLVHGSDVQRELRRGGVRVHRYVLNVPALYIIAGLSIAAFIGCGALWFGGFLANLAGQIGFGLALIVGVVASLVVSYWKGVGEKRFVAFSDDVLIVGEDESRAWVISWDLLDLQKFGFSDMHVSRTGGSLSIEVGGQSIPLLLYSPFASLENPQDFMFHVLTRLGSDNVEASDDDAPEE